MQKHKISAPLSESELLSERVLDCCDAIQACNEVDFPATRGVVQYLTGLSNSQAARAIAEGLRDGLIQSSGTSGMGSYGYTVSPPEGAQ